MRYLEYAIRQCHERFYPKFRSVIWNIINLAVFYDHVEIRKSKFKRFQGLKCVGWNLTWPSHRIPTKLEGLSIMNTKLLSFMNNITLNKWLTSFQLWCDIDEWGSQDTIDTLYILTLNGPKDSWMLKCSGWAVQQQQHGYWKPYMVTEDMCIHMSISPCMPEEWAFVWRMNDSVIKILLFDATLAFFQRCLATKGKLVGGILEYFPSFKGQFVDDIPYTFR